MTTSTAGARLPSSQLYHFLRIYPLQDLVLLAYASAVLLIVLMQEAAPTSAPVVHLVYGSLVASLLGGFICRSGLLASSLLRGVVYRVSILGLLLGNYLMLRGLLPLVRPDAVDGALYSLDKRLFGCEPAVWLERFNDQRIVEWFAFFYFSYFFIAIAYMLGVIWLRRADAATTELAIGITLIYSLGQLGYLLVPGVGPGKFLAGSFQGPVRGGFFWHCVMGVVSAGSALKDIFPSLHTAVPTYLSWFAWQQYRRSKRWAPAASLTTFFALNIIISTMLLRWHYAVDVLAGFLLASAAGLIVPGLAKREASFRRSLGMPAPWDFG